MTAPFTVVEVEYPYSDGDPMGESDLHRDLMFDVIELLRERYKKQNVYITGNLYLYFVEGDPSKFVCPDCMVLFDCSPHQRKSFKIWEEGSIPNVVIEVTSSSTKSTDLTTKPEIYQDIGVAEYFLYDPTGDYLDPPLRGFRMGPGAYSDIPVETDESIVSEQLGVRLYLVSGVLCVDDLKSGAPQLTRLENAEEERDQEREARLSAEGERDVEREARLAAEAEIERLRKLLGEH